MRKTGQGFLKDKPIRVFSTDELDTIWEQFFGKRYSLGHIADHFAAEKSKIISAIEQEAARRAK